MVEIKGAYNIIGEGAEYAEKIFPQIKQYYPAKDKESPIGFAKSNNSKENPNIFNQQS